MEVPPRKRDFCQQTPAATSAFPWSSADIGLTSLYTDMVLTLALVLSYTLGSVSLESPEWCTPFPIVLATTAQLLCWLLFLCLPSKLLVCPGLGPGNYFYVYTFSPGDLCLVQGLKYHINTKYSQISYVDLFLELQGTGPSAYYRFSWYGKVHMVKTKHDFLLQTCFLLSIFSLNTWKHPSLVAFPHSRNIQCINKFCQVYRQTYFKSVHLSSRLDCFRAS